MLDSENTKEPLYSGEKKTPENTDFSMFSETELGEKQKEGTNFSHKKI